MNKHSHNPNPSLTDHNAGSVTQIGGSARMSVEGTGLIAHNSSDNVNIHDTIHNNGVQNNLEQNQYGCNNNTMCIIISVLSLLLVVCIGIAIGVSYTDRLAAGIIWIVALLCLLGLIVSCSIRYCVCCTVSVDTH